MTGSGAPGRAEGLVFDVDTFAVHDGPGIRMAVYLKGCPLTCAWCHSPESQAAESEIVLLADRCVLCGACAAICSRGVHECSADEHVMAREHCAVCAQCVDQCPCGALAVMGRRVSAATIVERAVRLKPFFDHSGGGVTLTGGEVAAQADFAEAVLQSCQQQSIHTAIETAGHCAWDVLGKLASAADLVLYDLKLMDDALHRRYVGVSNRRILANARRLAGRNVQVRLALIPEITDTAENLRAVFDFLKEAGLLRLALLPYNPSSSAKYEWLGRTCRIEGRSQDPEHLGHLLAMARKAGLAAELG